MSDKKQLTLEEKMYAAFKADFPKEAYTALPGAAGLTALKAQYIVERLNDVAGIDGWEQVPSQELVDANGNPTHMILTDEYVLVCYKLEVLIGDSVESHSAFGSCKFSGHKREVSDVFKSARTDALSKAASHFGIGNDMFKGLIKPPKPAYNKSSPATASKAVSGGGKW